MVKQTSRTECQVTVSLEFKSRLSGSFQVFRGEALIGEHEWKAKQRKLMLKAIITRGAEGVPKDVLIEDLWPEISADLSGRAISGASASTA